MVASSPFSFHADRRCISALLAQNGKRTATREFCASPLRVLVYFCTFVPLTDLLGASVKEGERGSCSGVYGKTTEERKTLLLLLPLLEAPICIYISTYTDR